MRLLTTLLSWTFVLIGLTATAQDNNLEESTLPILSFETKRGEEVVTGFKRESDLILYDNGGVNRLTDTPTEVIQKAYVSFRGSSSLDFPKKNYGFELRDSATQEELKIGLLGMPKHDDWAIHGPYSDKTLIRNALTYTWGRRIQPYAPRTRYVSLVVNGSYEGIYLLTERIRRDNNRVDIAKLSEDETNGVEATGGFIVQIGDSRADEFRSWISDYSQSEGAFVQTQYRLDYPKFDSLGPGQFDYIEDFVRRIEDVMDSPNAYDVEDGYRQYVDIASWVDHALLQEISGNFDAYRRSTFLIKDRDDNNPRLQAGPVWDFNIAFGNDEMCMGTTVDGWVMDEKGTCPQKNLPYLVERMYEDPVFQAHLRERWVGLRQNLFSDARIRRDIDSLLAIVRPEQAADQRRWDQIGEYVWPNAFIGDDYAEEVAYLRDWIERRVAWMDANITDFPSLASLQSRNSHLPVVRVDVAGGDTITTGRIDAEMRVVDHGPDQLNSPDGTPTGYVGNVAIELIGAADEKSDYSFELRDEDGEDYDYRLLDMPKEADWLLLGPYSDKSLVRDPLAYELADQTKMDYAPRARSVVLYVNDEYRGIYTLTEKVKRDDSRVDIAKLNEDETSGDDLTGGYIIEVDGPSQQPGIGFTSTVDGTLYRYHTPDAADIVAEQRNYIAGWMRALEADIQSGGLDAVRDRIVENEFADYVLVQELAANSKGYRKSGYFYKDKDSDGGQLRAGPVWDFKRGFGNDSQCGGTDVEGWVVTADGRCGDQQDIPFWWRTLFADAEFQALLRQRWVELRTGDWGDEELSGMVRALTQNTKTEADANFALYPILNTVVGRNPFVAPTYGEHVDYLEDWLLRRALWIDGQFMFSGVDEGTRNVPQLGVTPNPSYGAGEVTVEWTHLGEVRPTSLELVNTVGQTVRRIAVALGDSRTRFAGADLPVGVYVLELRNASGVTARGRWVRQ